MDKSLILCTCVSCLKNNSDSKLVIQSIYYQHRKKTQILLEKELSDNEDMNVNLKNEENESEINEIEYLSASKEISEDDDFLDNEDYNIFNENNSEEDNDDDNDDNDDNDIMQIDEERLNKEIIEGLRLLHLKSLYN